METISILGYGWLGEPLGKALLKEGQKVIGSCRKKDKADRLQQVGLTAYTMNLTGIEQADAALWQAEVFIINIPPKRSDSTQVTAYPERINQLLEKIIQYAQNKRIWVIFASSTGVYGNHGSGRVTVTEQSSCRPVRASAQAIYQAEQCLRNYAHLLDITILRFAGLVGKQRQAGQFMAGRQGLKTANKAVNLVHLEDCIAIIQQLLQQNIRNEIFNICADLHPIHQVFYPAQALKLGLQPPSYTADKVDNVTIICNQKIKRVLGYNFIWPDPMKFPLK